MVFIIIWYLVTQNKSEDWMNPLFLPFIWNGVTSASLANPSVFVAQVYSASDVTSSTNMWAAYWTMENTYYRGKGILFVCKSSWNAFPTPQIGFKHICSILWVWMFWTWWFGAESFCMVTSTFLLLVHKGCQGFHSCLVLPSICQHVPTVDWEFDLEPLIRRNLISTWEFC